MPEYVDITPHVSLLAKVGQAGHSVAEAVSELVDNSLDARSDDAPVRVDVTYDVRGKWIRIVDDAGGMSRSELAQALVLALSSKDAEKIGKFGLGMKSACTSLGQKFSITTCREQDHYEWIAEYDETTFVSSGQWRLPIRRRKKRQAHGTTIYIDSNRVYHGVAQSLIKNLAWTFRHFIADGLLVLQVNGQLVERPQHQIDESTLLPLAGSVAGHPVRGWVALLQVSSQRGSYGFDLVRHRRVIRRHEKIGFQAHPQTARVIGELHLDRFATNNLKTNFVRETEEWRELEAWLGESIEPVVAASRALAHAGSFDRRLRDLIARERSDVLSALGDGVLHDVLDIRQLSRNGRVASEAVGIVVGPFHVEHLFVRDSDAPYMHRERVARSGESDVIRVETNLSFAELSSDVATWGCHNVAEALALELSTTDDYVDTKSRIWASLGGQPGLARALRRSASVVTPHRDSPTKAV
ncbi:MAG: hypothetical protein QOD83_2146 [Solirubrobacteraceae bacterium]|jgi:hypothetical protein|nr:hypothetical protein [Solirubrobacteraceae bacterium]